MTYAELRKLVNEQGDVLTITMADLKEAHEVQRLGVHVLEQIRDCLFKEGLGHSPLSLRAGDKVRLYNVQTDLGAVLVAAATPGKNEDSVLREVVSVLHYWVNGMDVDGPPIPILA